MNIIGSIVHFIAFDVLSQPAILLGLVACIGLAAQRKPGHQIVLGTVKTIAGFLVIVAGAGAVVGALSPFGNLVGAGFHLRGLVPNDEATVGYALATYGSQAALVFTLGFLLNVLLARITPFKFVYLTGHIMFYNAILIVAVLGSVGGLSGWVLVAVGAALLGVYSTLAPAYIHRYVHKATDGAGFAMGHSANFAAFLGGLLGRYVGDPKDSIEDLKLPESLSILRDTTLSTSLTMAVIYLITVLLVGPTIAQAEAGTQNYIVWAIMKGVGFGVGVTIILLGVRMLIAEIVPAFKGFSDKIVPGAIPALDCPTVLPYAPTAWMIAFIISFVTGLVGMFVLIGMKAAYIIIPGVVPHFFGSGPAGVLANATGGRRAVVVAGILGGLIITFGIAALAPYTGILADSGSMVGESEYATWGLLFAAVTQWLASGQWVLVAAILAGVLILGILAYRMMRGKREVKARTVAQ